jgi:hypothetical protein
MAGPARYTRKRCQRGRDQVVSFTLELDVSAERNRREPAVGLAPLEAQEPLAEAEGEDEHPHAERLGRDQVSELVYEDDDPENDDEREGGGQEAHVIR